LANSVRLASAVLICCAGLSSRVHAQEGVKIVLSWGTNWDIGSSVTYIDGDFERSDGYWGRSVTTDSRMDSMSLRKCGDWSASYLVHGTTLYEEDHSPSPEGRSQEPGNGLVKVQVEFVDTGERLPKFGSTAQHIITTVRYDYSQSTCSRENFPTNMMPGISTGRTRTSVPNPRPLTSLLSVATTELLSNRKAQNRSASRSTCNRKSRKKTEARSSCPT
jgi:hypothetical protein